MPSFDAFLCFCLLFMHFDAYRCLLMPIFSPFLLSFDVFWRFLTRCLSLFYFNIMKVYVYVFKTKLFVEKRDTCLYCRISSLCGGWGGIFSLFRVCTWFEVCTPSEKGYDTWEKMSLKKEEDEECKVLKKNGRFHRGGIIHTLFPTRPCTCPISLDWIYLTTNQICVADLRYYDHCQKISWIWFYWTTDLFLH
jgi:hypothetical protein